MFTLKIKLQCTSLVRDQLKNKRNNNYPKRAHLLKLALRDQLRLKIPLFHINLRTWMETTPLNRARIRRKLKIRNNKIILTKMIRKILIIKAKMKQRIRTRRVKMKPKIQSKRIKKKAKQRIKTQVPPHQAVIQHKAPHQLKTSLLKKRNKRDLMKKVMMKNQKNNLNLHLKNNNNLRNNQKCQQLKLRQNLHTSLLWIQLAWQS